MRKRVLIPISEVSLSPVNHQNILNWVTGLNGRQFTLQIRMGGSLESMNGPAGLYPEGQLRAVKKMLWDGYIKAGYRYMSWSETEDGWQLVGTHSGRDDGEKTLAVIYFKEASATSSKWLASKLKDPEILEEMQNGWEGLGSLFG